MDLFGVVVVAVVTAIGGGTERDVLLVSLILSGLHRTRGRGLR